MPIIIILVLVIDIVLYYLSVFVFFQAEDGIRDLVRSRGLGDVYKRQDFTSLSTNLNAGSAYTLNLTPGFAGAAYLEYWRVWIDYNGDLDWSDAGEQVGQGKGSSAINVAFTVPSGTPSGTKRLRVSMKYSGYATSCGTFTYGEVEDYNVIIGGGSGPTCSDGIQNQGETGVDCGGPCPACPTCGDGIQNQGETGIDCGGPVSYTHLRAHETVLDLVCRLLLEKKK